MPTLLASLTTYNTSRKQFSASDFSRSLRNLRLTPSTVSHALFNHNLQLTKPLVLAGLDSIIGCNAVDYFCPNSAMAYTGPQAYISQGIANSISAWNGIYIVVVKKMPPWYMRTDSREPLPLEPAEAVWSRRAKGKPAAAIAAELREHTSKVGGVHSAARSTHV
jgi:hypothetical protein